MPARFPTVETGTVTCPACGQPVDLPVTVLPVPVGSDSGRFLATMPPVIHACGPTIGGAP